MKTELPTETNWEMCQRLAREANKDELIQQLLVQIAHMRKPRERTTPLWSFVGQATMHGSGVSCAICAVYGVDSTTGELASTELRAGAAKAVKS